jgi:cysteine desulfurase
MPAPNSNGRMAAGRSRPRFLTRHRGQKASNSGRCPDAWARRLKWSRRVLNAIETMTQRAYLDWNATAPLHRRARDAMIVAMDLVGNPSSVHAEGRAARRLVEEARGQLAALVGAEPGNIIFTSGGTEANMLALSPATGPGRYERLLISAIEHPAVMAGGSFPAAAVEKVPVTAQGVIDLSALRRALSSGGRALVSVMLANNETGVVQPICEVARLVHEAGSLLHVDAVQALGRIPCDIRPLGADLMTVSGHKIGGPKGAGALVKRDQALHIEPLITGGGQERRARAGTENVVGIAGFGAAAAAVQAEFAAEVGNVGALRGMIEHGIRATSPDAVIYGADVERVPNTTLFSVPGMRAETAVIAFDLDGVAVSSGAACSSGKVTPSHVLLAMGVPPLLARGAVRVSVGPTTAESEVEHFLSAWRKLFSSLTNRQEKAA